MAESPHPFQRRILSPSSYRVTHLPRIIVCIKLERSTLNPDCVEISPVWDQDAQ